MRAVGIGVVLAAGLGSLVWAQNDVPNATLTAVPGIKVGHVTLPSRPTGCTVILTENGAVAGVDVRGAAPGTRETDLLDPVNTVDPTPGGNTTLGVVATNRALTKAQATKVAQMAHDGLARTIYPIHTPADGDTIFALATGTDSGPADVGRIGALAAHAIADAVLRAARSASGLPGYPAARDLERQ